MSDAALEENDYPKNQQATILFIDDEVAILKALKRFGRSQGWNVLIADSPTKALNLAEEIDIDVVVSDMRMPEMNGAEVLKLFLAKWPDTMRILLTGYNDINTFGKAVNEAHIFNYLTKPWDDTILAEVITGALRTRESELEKLRLEKLTKEQNVKLGKLALLLDKRVKERSMEVDQALQLLQDSHSRSKEALLDSVAVINRILEWKEGRAHGQSEFVTYYAVEIANELQLSDADIESIRLSALLHRVGMLALPDSIRTKPLYALSADELKTYRQYPLWGERSIKHSLSLAGIANIVRHHKEYINGNGFPDGLTTTSIPIAAQIVGLVSDFYDAYSGQIDKNIQGIEAAKTYINEWAGRRHDTGLVAIFWQVLGDFCNITLRSCVLATADLRNDMILEEDLYSRSGILLLAKQTVITQAHIKKLEEYEVTYREVFEINIRVDDSEQMEANI